MNLQKGFFRLTIFVSVIVTSVSFYFFSGVFRPFYISNLWIWGFFFFYDDLAKTIGCSLMCGGVVWIIYFFAKFVVAGFVTKKE